MTSNSFFGFLALATYVTTLIPSNIAKVFPPTKKWKINRFLVKHRRILGLTAFALSIDHIVISLAKYDISLLDLATYQTYYTGVAAFIILTLLAFTSNEWSINKLKRNWKTLHQLTYVAMFLLLWHIFALMKHSCTWLTPIALYLISLVSIIFVLSLLIAGKNTFKKKVKIIFVFRVELIDRAKKSQEKITAKKLPLLPNRLNQSNETCE